MVSLVILLPALIALGMLNRHPASLIAQKVYVPLMLLFPLYLQFRVGGFSVVATSIPGIALAFLGVPAWSRSIKFSFVDACVFGFVFGEFYSDFHQHAMNVATYALYDGFTRFLCPYIIGRTMIEQSGRRNTIAKVVVTCMVVVALTSLWEYGTGSDPYKLAAEKLSRMTYALGGQTRWGFTRITGPWGQAIIAGLTFCTGLFFQFWLVATKGWSGLQGPRVLRGRRFPLYLTLSILLGIFMTQSRGPWIGCAFGLIVASVGFAKNRRRAVFLAIGTLAVAGSFTSVVLDKYTGADVTKTKDRDQLNAEYRRELIATYAPLVAEGGLWGWGTPHAVGYGGSGYSDKQTSIDNEYLLVAMQQGYAGVTLFIAALVFSHIHLIRLCATLRNRQDILFAYCMLAALVSISFTLTTVALLDPMVQFLFLMLGWSQSLIPTKTRDSEPAIARAQLFKFERVFV